MFTDLINIYIYGYAEGGDYCPASVELIVLCTSQIILTVFHYNNSHFQSLVLREVYGLLSRLYVCVLYLFIW